MTKRDINRVLAINPRVDGYQDNDGIFHFYMRNARRNSCGHIRDFSLQTSKTKIFAYHVELYTRAPYDLGELVDVKITNTTNIDDAINAILTYIYN